MKITLLFGFFSVFVICYCECELSTREYQIQNLIRNENNVKNVFKLWKCEGSIVLGREKRSTNTTAVVETVYRIANSVEPNLTNSANSSTENKHALLIASFKRIWPVSEWEEYGFFTEDYLDLINEHWLRFPPPSETFQKSLGGFYVLFTTVGCWGNIIVLLMYLR